jgi:Coenzyme PQQ synthesis protein D (PqqD)
VYLAVSRTGAVVWSLLAEGSTRDELIDAVVARFTVGRDDAGRDLDEFLSDLDRRGLLESSG